MSEARGDRRGARRGRAGWLWAAAALLWVAGCGGGGGDEAAPAPGAGVVRQGNELVRAGSGLVLVLPADLPAQVSDAALARVFAAAEADPNCRNAGSGRVPFLLAQACLEFRRLYLFAENLPTSLDGVADVAAYVDALRQGGGAQAPDPFVSFFPAPTFQQVVTPGISGDRAIIGLRLGVAGAGGAIGPESPLTVREVLPFSRAWHDGIRAGDRLVEVDGHPLDGLTLAEALDVLPRGEGQGVTLTLLRGETRVTVATAAEEHIAFLLAEGIGYLSVRRYTAVTGARVRADVEALVAGSSPPPDRFILDLRGNGGGSVTGALTLTDYLIDEDQPPFTHPIMGFADRDGRRENRYLGGFPTSFALGAAQNLPGVGRATFAVLVDGGSASASEITVAALRHYGRAQVVGTRTFGKGLRQDVVTLVDGSGLFIPSRRVVDPVGLSWDGVGIAPDVVVEAEATQDRDPQLEAALAWLTAGTLPAARLTARRPPRDPAAQDPWVRQISAGFR